MEAISNAADESNYLRVQVLTPVNVLNCEKQLGVVRELTDIVAAAANDPALSARTGVLITESPESGWGISGHANTSADIIAAARAEIEVEAKEPCKKWRANSSGGRDAQGNQQFSIPCTRATRWLLPGRPFRGPALHVKQPSDG